jgi:hypothetical protein
MEAELKKRIQELRNLDMYFENDNRVFTFFEINPENTNDLIVHEKISAINHGIISLSLVPDVSRRILSLNIDQALSSEDLNIVEELRDMPKWQNETQTILHFFSSYCNFHKPSVYPVFSVNTISILQLFQEKIPDQPFHGINGSMISSYIHYKESIDELRGRYSLEKLNYHELEKFLWINTGHIKEFISRRSS